MEIIEKKIKKNSISVITAATTGAFMFPSLNSKKIRWKVSWATSSTKSFLSSPLSIFILFHHKIADDVHIASVKFFEDRVGAYP
ncbi:MAG: hypothetical protein H3Z49_03335 [archaeon]|nr:hypothetical protein [archaeon]